MKKTQKFQHSETHLGVIISKLEARRNISTRLKQISAYADVIIIERTTQVMIDTLTILNNEAAKYGLLINESKTKYIKCTRKQVRENSDDRYTYQTKE
jgi:hypothetical protein